MRVSGVRVAVLREAMLLLLILLLHITTCNIVNARNCSTYALSQLERMEVQMRQEARGGDSDVVGGNGDYVCTTARTRHQTEPEGTFRYKVDCFVRRDT